MGLLRDPDFSGDLTLAFVGDLVLRGKVDVAGEVVADALGAAVLHTRPGWLGQEGPAITLQGARPVVTGSRGSGS